MAKPKKSVHIELLNAGLTKSIGIIHVWCDEPEKAVDKIDSIEGVTDIHLNSLSMIEIWTDPRYDAEEISREIETLLTAEVPAVFRD